MVLRRARNALCLGVRSRTKNKFHAELEAVRVTVITRAFSLCGMLDEAVSRVIEQAEALANEWSN